MNLYKRSRLCFFKVSKKWLVDANKDVIQEQSVNTPYFHAHFFPIMQPYPISDHVTTWQFFIVYLKKCIMNCSYIVQASHVFCLRKDLRFYINKTCSICVKYDNGIANSSSCELNHGQLNWYKRDVWDMLWSSSSVFQRCFNITNTEDKYDIYDKCPCGSRTGLTGKYWIYFDWWHYKFCAERALIDENGEVLWLQLLN